MSTAPGSPYPETPEIPPADPAEEPAAPEGAGVPAAAARPLDRLGRGLLATVALGITACVGLVLWADARQLVHRLGEFDPRLLPPILGFSLVNYAVRFWRWQLYLESLGIDLPWGRSLAVYLVGFLLSVTPGKAGELGKAWLVRELGGGPALKVVPAVLAERVTDLLGVIALLSLGALPFPGGPWFAAGGFALLAGAVLVLTWERGAGWIFRQLGRLPLVGRRISPLTDVYHRLRGLLSPRLLAAGLAAAIVAWGAEGMGFVLAVRQYQPGAGMLAGIFNYNLATVVGSLSMIPGGLLAAEGSLTALLGAQGLSTAAAASATLVIRAATLWFAVLLGLCALPYVARRLAERRAPDGVGLP